jgi:hypothetical protein
LKAGEFVKETKENNEKNVTMFGSPSENNEAAKEL